MAMRCDFRSCRHYRRRDRFLARKAYRRPATAVPLRSGDDCGRRGDAASARHRRQSGRSDYAVDRDPPDRNRARDRCDLRLFRHRRRVSDRSRINARQRHADPQRHRLIAVLGRQLRPDHGDQLCALRLDRLDDRSSLHCRRLGWRLSRHALRDTPGEKPAHAYVIFAGVIFAVAIYMLARTGLPPWLSFK